MWLKNGTRLFEVPEASDLAERLVGEGYQSVDGPNTDIAQETSEPSADEALAWLENGTRLFQVPEASDLAERLVGEGFQSVDGPNADI